MTDAGPDGWIDVRSTPPPLNTPILIRAHTGHMAVATCNCWAPGRFSWYPQGLSGPEWDWDWEEPATSRKHLCGGVTHWRHLPDQPEEPT